MRVTTYKQAFEGVLGIRLTEKVMERIRRIEREGYPEKSIAYTVWLKQEKLLRFKGDQRFWGILHNEVRKHGFKKGVPFKRIV